MWDFRKQKMVFFVDTSILSQTCMNFFRSSQYHWCVICKTVLISFFVIAEMEDFGFNEATFRFVEWEVDVRREIQDEDEDDRQFFWGEDLN